MVNCTLLVKGSGESLDVNEIRQCLETGSDKAKIEAMTKVLTAMANGDGSGAGLLMHVIRFVMPNQKNKYLKKLVFLFVELVPKVDADGKLLQEMILLCNALRSDLQHPNEYVRGVTLRLVCKLQEPELLEPLLSVVRTCLEHNHAYVRRNAIFAVWAVFRQHDWLIPDAAELIEQVLAAESDTGCQRNAFAMLAATEPARASTYYDTIAGRLEGLDAQLQQAVIEFMVSHAGADGSQMAKYTQGLFGMVSSSGVTAAVRYEACGALMTLSAAPAAIRAVAGCFTEMAVREADNNVKLVVLERLAALQKQHAAVVNEGILDVLRVLACPDAEVRRRAIELVLGGVSGRVAEETVGHLRKELQRARGAEGQLEYKRSVLRAVHVIAGRFPETAAAAVACWAEFLGDAEASSVLELPAYIKEALEGAPGLHDSTVEVLAEALPGVTQPAVAQALLWTLAEFASRANVEAVLAAVRTGLGPLPLTTASEPDEDADLQPTTKTRVLADGTYVMDTAQADKAPSSIPVLKKMLLAGHHAVGASVALALTKLMLRDMGWDAAALNARKADVLLTVTAILRLGLSPQPAVPLDEDTYDRAMLCIQVLARPDAALADVLATHCHAAFKESLAAKSGPKTAVTPPDAPLQFRLQRPATLLVAPDYAQKDLERALHDSAATGSAPRLASALSKVVQLTGFSDPVYAETYVHVHARDIVLDVLLVNQTDTTLTGLSLDLATSGDLKVVDKPAPLTLAPRGFATARLALKVCSTGNGLVYGALSYGSVEPKSVILAPIPIDIVDYIRPAQIDEAAFRSGWLVLEWENKIVIDPVAVSAATGPASELKFFLDALLKACHLACITPAMGLADSGDYLAACMYARSVFSEDVLGNICLERSADPEGRVVVSGHVRLRSKTQGIAVALGDKITAFVAAHKR